MARTGDEPDRDELDDFVRAFEEAYAREGHAEIAEFLPPPDHPLHAVALRELIRVDLEYGWERGRPKSLSDYQRAFPGLRRDGDGLREIAFEESRLRRQAEEGPAPGGARRRDERMTADWPSRRGAGETPGRHARVLASDRPWGFDSRTSIRDQVERLRNEGIERTTLTYGDFRLHCDEGDDSVSGARRDSSPDLVDPTPRFRVAHPSGFEAADRPARGLATLPGEGDDLLGFRLIGELGRGAFGRVYLARQGDLADRLVTLKVSSDLLDEPQMLAQMQHTNIVPIYSIHRVEPYQVICMPYFGSTTLKDVYDDLKVRETLPSSGKGLLTTLYDRKGRAGSRSDSGASEVEEAGAPASAPAEGPAPSQSGRSTDTLRLLEGLTYIQAVLWMAARLADGLAYAHERGILHRDLKPANILLTDEGQPMLLDFNLSRDLKAHSGAGVGGTLPYMAPEHLDALRDGARPVDARSDLYSLGIILYELLTGRRPFEIPKGPPDGLLDHLIRDRLGPPPGVRRWNKAATPAVESIVRRCLEPDAECRYQTARELQEDLGRHLADRPLRHAPEPSLLERMAKWVRRHPTASSSTTISSLGLILIALLTAFGWLKLEDYRVDRARVHHDQFRSDLEMCQILLNTYTEDGSSENLDRGVRLARRALSGYGVGGPGDWVSAPLVRRLPPDERRALLEEVSELVQLEVRARVALAERKSEAPRLRRALREGIASLDAVERFDPRPSAALYEDRGRFHAALGRGDLAARDRALAARVEPTSARDFYLLGTSLLARGQPDRAELPLARAVDLDARRFWAWFALGICHDDQGRHADAVFDFSVCTTLRPRADRLGEGAFGLEAFAWPHLNRGLALARSGRLPEARAAYDRALEIRPDFAEALVDRALTCLELDDRGQALRDLDRVVSLGRGTPSVLAARAEALARLDRRAEAERAFAEAIEAGPDDPMPLVARGFSRLSGDPAGAESDFAGALALDPRNARARLGRAHLLRDDDPRAALAQVESALDSDPNFGDALQLRALLHARLGEPAAEADVDRLVEVPTPQRLYNAACALSLLSRSVDNPRLVSRAIDLLRRALDAGLTPTFLAQDPDLDALRTSPRFSRLLDPIRQE